MNYIDRYPPGRYTPTYIARPAAPAAAWTQDGTSGKGAPANASEWTAALASAGITKGNPSALYNLQEASGNPADSIGTFTLTASGTGLGYQAAVTGWTRKMVSTTDGGTGKLANTDATLPSLTAQSQLLLAYVMFPAAIPGTVRGLIGMGVSTTRAAAEINATTGKAQIVSNTTVQGAANAANGLVRPVVLKVDRTNSTAVLYTEAEKIVGSTGVNPAGQSITLGNFSRLSIGGGYLYAVSFFNGAAELTDAEVKTLLQTLGWTILWT